jgi:RimJ/RimL family protein N-acetyltransferase
MIEPGALLQAVMRPSNLASRRVAERLGMVFCGAQPDHAGIADLVYQQFARELK